jgi:hypothetical protein
MVRSYGAKQFCLPTVAPQQTHILLKYSSFLSPPHTFLLPLSSRLLLPTNSLHPFNTGSFYKEAKVDGPEIREPALDRNGSAGEMVGDDGSAAMGKLGSEEFGGTITGSPFQVWVGLAIETKERRSQRCRTARRRDVGCRARKQVGGSNRGSNRR